jgi:hypothetical protein
MSFNAMKIGDRQQSDSTDFAENSTDFARLAFR